MSSDPLSYVSENCAYFVFKPQLSSDVICKYFEDTVREIDAIVCERSKSYVSNCTHYANIPPSTANDKSHAYLWVESKEILRVFMGRNHDGTAIRDSTAVSSRIADNSSKGVKDTLFNMDWSFSSIETPVVHYEKYVVKPVPGYERSPFVCQAKGIMSDETYDFGTLFCRTPLPGWYKEEYLFEIFQTFNTNKAVPVNVTKTFKGNAYIKFPIASDACFALMMTKKYRDVSREVELSFDHALYREPTPAKRINKKPNSRGGRR